MKHRLEETTYKIMSSIKSKNTKPERLLGKALWKTGIRYRKNYGKLVGKPDFVLVSKRIAIFCDGDFWHGNNWKIRGLNNLNEELNKYSSFWKSKILRNIKRDQDVNQVLEAEGWIVLRFWESDIKKDIEKIVEKIKGLI